MAGEAHRIMHDGNELVVEQIEDLPLFFAGSRATQLVVRSRSRGCSDVQRIEGVRLPVSRLMLDHLKAQQIQLQHVACLQDRLVTCCDPTLLSAHTMCRLWFVSNQSSPRQAMRHLSAACRRATPRCDSPSASACAIPRPSGGK